MEGRRRAELAEMANYRAVCPWCLFVSTRDRFADLNADGSIAKLLRCPECGQQMKVQTSLRVDGGPEAYSIWFWEQVVSFKNRDRVSWDKLKARVREMGFEYEFWNAYRKVKSSHSKPM